MMFKRPGPLVQMTLAMVTMTASLVLLADLLLGITPDGGTQRAQVRRVFSETLAVQVAALLQADDRDTLERTLRDVATRVKGVASVAVRRDDGLILVAAGPHEAAWKSAVGDGSTPDHVRVPLAANGERWGAVEVAYEADKRTWIARALESPLVRLLAFLSLAGAVAYALYMRRALQHLDPASVIPDRVQRAFDAMAEGVVVLDARARVLLTNKSFRELHPEAAQVRIGQTLSAVPWLAEGLPGDITNHPWSRAMTERRNTSGDSLTLLARADATPDDNGTPDARKRQLVINCAPITDAGGAVRGCLATFNDMSELHRANEALHRAMEEVWASKEEIHRKNQELERLATRDPLTGCLNRRAFVTALPALITSCGAKGTALGCLMIDIDFFKSINDTHGHTVGDRVIQEVARKLQSGARGSDLVCRYGGEEFCVVAPGLDAQSLVALAERIRERVELEAGLGVREIEGLRVTVSIGAAISMGAHEPMEKLIDRADQALYRAKHGGRNRVMAFSARAAVDTVAVD
jgi:diguanylate cyclase (GGDEF)-like protein